MFWKASVLEKTEGNKDFCFIAKLKVIPVKPSVLCYKKSKQKENRTEGNKGTLKKPEFVNVNCERPLNMSRLVWNFSYLPVIV